MRKQNFLSVLLLCGILSQGSGISLEENLKESSDCHIRRKRLIDKTPDGDRLVRIQQVPYIVNVLKNYHHTCSASILSPRILISAAHCFQNPGIYTILSGVSYVTEGNRHNVTRVLRHPQYIAHAYKHDLALLEIFPPINFDLSDNRKISLYHGHIPQNSFCDVSGWGCNHINEEGCMRFPFQLRSINVPTISQERCRRAYEHQTDITDIYICTLDEEKYCAKGDSGAPLVFERLLAGVFVWSGGRGGANNPDVYVNLSHHIYREWILSNLY